MKKLTDPERIKTLFEHIDQTGGAEACWLWTGTARTITAGGYPLVRWRGRTHTAAKVIMCITRGLEPAPGLVCRHTCDAPACCNPAHLVPGTALDNARDCIDRNRRAKTYRPHTRTKKLDADQVRAIRRDARPLRAIAEQYAVSLSTISQIRNRKAKAGIPD